MFEKTLPIGSVVSLYNGTKRVMILGYLKMLAGGDGTVYDYCGVPYPEGFLDAKKTAVFNHRDIEHIYALGYQNDDQFAFRRRLSEILAEREDSEGTEGE